MYFCIGTYHGKAGNKLISHLADKYGPLVRFKGFGISDSIIVTDPKDAEKVGTCTLNTVKL